MLCHSPQERLFIDGGWREGLLPPIEALPAGERGDDARRTTAPSPLPSPRLGGASAFAIPTARSRWSDRARRARRGHVRRLARRATACAAPALRWYLDYCCRDDYGAGSGARLGLGRAALLREPARLSRAGRRRRAAADGGDGVLTWPEGNAWLAERLAAPLGERLHRGPRRARRRRRPRRGRASTPGTRRRGQRERWIAPRVVLATPLFVAARLLAAPPPALREAARAMRHAPWLVANLQLDAALDDRPGAPPSWDNVAYGSAGLGYVDAMHQSTRPFAGPTVLTAYWALGGGDAAASSPSSARACSASDWRAWAARVVADLAPAHPDLPAKLAPRRPDALRPRDEHSRSRRAQQRGARRRSAAPQRRVQFAHADLSAYSVFEEAFFHGTRAGRAAAAREPAAADRRAAPGAGPQAIRCGPATSLEPRSARMKQSPGSGPAARLSNASFFLILLALLTVALRGGDLAVLRRRLLGRRAGAAVPAALPQAARAACAAGATSRRWRRSRSSCSSSSCR